jgi:hypothetical protein
MAKQEKQEEEVAVAGSVAVAVAAAVAAAAAAAAATAVANLMSPRQPRSADEVMTSATAEVRLELLQQQLQLLQLLR